MVFKYSLNQNEKKLKYHFFPPIKQLGREIVIKFRILQDYILWRNIGVGKHHMLLQLRIAVDS